MHNATIMFGEVTTVSNDKGPFKGLRVKSDDHEFPAEVLETGGYHQSPMKGSKVVVALVGGDMGKAFIIGGQAPKDRVDGQKEGMVTIKNHKRGQNVVMDDDGNITVTLSATHTTDANDVVVNASTTTINGDVEINGTMTFNGQINHTGNMSTSGVHTDSIGNHDA